MAEEIDEFGSSFKRVGLLDHEYSHFLMTVPVAYYDKLVELFSTLKSIPNHGFLNDEHDPLLTPHAILEITLDYFLKIPNYDVLVVADCLAADCVLWSEKEYLRTLKFYYEMDVSEPFNKAMLETIIGTAVNAAYLSIVGSGLIGMTENPLSFCGWNDKYAFLAKGMRKTDLCSFRTFK